MSIIPEKRPMTLTRMAAVAVQAMRDMGFTFDNEKETAHALFLTMYFWYMTDSGKIGPTGEELAKTVQSEIAAGATLQWPFETQEKTLKAQSLRG